MPHVETVRRALVEYFENKARLREEKMQQYPDDFRNARSAEALRGVTAYISAQSSDDDLLQAFAKCPGLFPAGDVFTAPSECSDAASQSDHEAFKCGFHTPVGSAAAWFGSWSNLVAQEVGEQEYSNDFDEDDRSSGR